MEMEEVFLQLWEEVSRLQVLCSEQGKLLRRLKARKGPVLDIPVSLPIQCTEDTAPGEGERPPGNHQGHSEAPTPSPSNPGGSAHPMEQPQGPNRFPPNPGNGRSPPSPGNSISGIGGAARALGGCGAGKVDVHPWMKTWILPAPQEGGRALCSPQELEAPNPVVGGSFLSVLDLYGAPETLRREDAPGDGAVPVEAPVPVEIRGPGKTSWTPGWMLEEGTLGQDSIPPSQAAQACDVCQEIFPSDAAGQKDYLNHILAHME